MPGHVVASGLTKRFGSVMALDDVSAEFLPGEIHAVLGENGAGKSTLMSVLAGFLVPQEGSVTLDGQGMPLGSPQRCIELGVDMVHQHFTLVPAFTVAESLAMAAMHSLARPLNVKVVAAPSLGVAEQLGWRLDPSARIMDLPVGVQQRIEILKCLRPEAQVLIFDEPTAVLSKDEVQDLFRVLRSLKQQGKTIILIAHKLAEVMEIADRVTVLRRGVKVASALVKDTNQAELAAWMVGEMPLLGSSSEAADAQPGLTCKSLRVRGDRGEEAVRGVDLAVGRGEIVGVGGVDGNGQVELAEAFAGVRSFEGELSWAGQPVSAGLKIAYIPQDRQEDGLALTMTIADNLLIVGHEHPELRKGSFLRMKAIGDWVSRLIQRFSIKTESADLPASSLSGGNQQKVVVARSLDEQPDLLVAVNPTRGLDIKASQFVHDQLREARNQGAAVVLISTDLDELAALSDRTVFLSRGQFTSGSGAEALVG